jgi:hypothetical protein
LAKRSRPAGKASWQKAEAKFMKALFWIGLLLLILGVLSLFVPFPSREHHGVEIGGAEVGIETQSSSKVSPLVSAALIGAGAVMLIAGRRTSS